MQKGEFNSLVFQHLVEFPSFDCVFCSTQESLSGRKKLFLIFNERKTVYLRNGIKETWDRVSSEEECNTIRDGYDIAIKERRIPCYTT